MTDLINRVNAFGQKQIEEAEAKKRNEANREVDYLEQIQALKPRIIQLMEVGNACLRNGIPLTGEAWGGRQNYDTHQFCTNCWSHLTGFIADSNKIVGVGKFGGGACDYDLRVYPGNEDDRMYIEAEGGRLYVLGRFISEFDEFERKLYEYVESVVGK